MSFDVPVLFTVFNRPAQASQVLAQIRNARPKKIYVSSDGARPYRPDDQEQIDQVRKLINSIDWDCEKKVLFHDRNLGCKKAMVQAINWFFENEEKGIILEDDCLPDPSFFHYCSMMLDQYNEEDRVLMISGDDFRFDQAPVSTSYYFTHYVPIWGWATWRRAWKLYEPNMESWPEFRKSGKIFDIIPNRNEARFFDQVYDRTYRGQIDTWDYQWSYTILRRGGLSICPNGNLISNIGPTGAHMDGSNNKFMSMARVGFPLNKVVHPQELTVPNGVDEAIYGNVVGSCPPAPLHRRAISLASQVMNKINPERWG